MENKMRVLMFLLLLVLVNTIRTVEAETGAEVDAEYVEEKRSTCNDIYSSCPGWASNGECENHPDWMLINCRLSCKQCGENTTNIIPRALPPTCIDGANVYSIGETYVKGCTTYKCVSDGYMKWDTKIVSTLCRDYYGVCRYPGNTFAFSLHGRLRHNCHCTIYADFTVYYQCRSTHTGGVYPTTRPSNNLDRGNCFVDGKVFAVGETFDKNCSTYKCFSDGFSWWRADVISAKCKDAHGFCRFPGETFPYVIDGRLWHNCQCTKGRNFIIQYSCQGYL